MSSDSEVTPTPEFDTSKSTKSREEVRGEVGRARDAGEAIAAGEATPTPEIDSAGSAKTREQVRKELDEYIQSGQRDRDRGETQIGG
jgi:hypothetical protein